MQRLSSSRGGSIPTCQRTRESQTRSQTKTRRPHRNVFRNESWTDIPQVPGTDYQVFQKQRNKWRTRVVVLDMRNVEDPARREHSRGERRLIQATINLTKSNHMIKQVEIPQILCAAEADHQSLESHTASLEHVKASRRLYISRRD